MIVRKLWPWEGGAIRDHLLRLGPEDRLMRFGAPASDRFLDGYCTRVAQFRILALGGFADGALRGVAELVRIPDEARPSLELALSVERPYQDRGIGGRLLAGALVVARNRLLRSVHIFVLPQNEKMRRLAGRSRAGVKNIRQNGETHLHLPWPTAASILDEMAMECQARVSGACGVTGWPSGATITGACAGEVETEDAGVGGVALPRRHTLACAAG